MLKLVCFNPNPKLASATILRQFIKMCREELTLWNDEPGFSWESPYWPESTRRGRLRFTNYVGVKLHPSVQPRDDQLLHPAFIDVAKAYLRYRHTTKPHPGAARELQAFRALEKALVDEMGVPDITKIRLRHFNKATELLSNLEARQFVCSTLIEILKTFSDLLIVPAEVGRWQNPYVKGNSYRTTNGADAPSETKLQKVANQDAFLSVAEVFSRPPSQLDESDIMVTSMTALLLSAPMRIGESIRWRTNFLRSDFDKEGTIQYYLAYYVPKTRSYTRKAVPTTIAEIAKIAADRLISITEESRKLAMYMETEPVKFYRHADCPDVPDDQELTPNQVAQALGFLHRKSCEKFIRKYTGNYALTGFTLNSLWVFVLQEHRMQNPHFPYQEKPKDGLKPLKMSESLMCFRRLQLAPQMSTSPILLAPFNPNYYRQRLDGAAKNGRPNRPMCFFTKNGFEPQRLNSHSLRHFVNRLAKQHGVSIELITEWSSRASVQQTRTYLHQTDEQRAQRSAIIMKTGQEHETLDPVTDEEAANYGEGPYHRSRYGICRRSWRVGPCNKFADCTNCSELLACKGDKMALAAVKADRDNMVRTFNAAQRAIAAGERSASLWIEKATPQINRLTDLVSVMENPNIPDGSPIELIGTDFSHEALIVEEKAKEAGVRLLDKEQLALEYGQDLLDCLNMLVD